MANPVLRIPVIRMFLLLYWYTDFLNARVSQMVTIVCTQLGNNEA
jgi:hypothetical protein